eukprot:768473-Hanusia_phi.AAC.5
MVRVVNLSWRAASSNASCRPETIFVLELAGEVRIWVAEHLRAELPKLYQASQAQAGKVVGAKSLRRRLQREILKCRDVFSRVDS